MTPKVTDLSLAPQTHRSFHFWTCQHFMYFAPTCPSPAYRLPPGLVKRTSEGCWPSSKKSNKSLWFSSVETKRFHFSAFSLKDLKACSLMWSMRSSLVKVEFKLRGRFRAVLGKESELLWAADPNTLDLSSRRLWLRGEGNIVQWRRSEESFSLCRTNPKSRHVSSFHDKVYW